MLLAWTLATHHLQYQVLKICKLLVLHLKCLAETTIPPVHSGGGREEKEAQLQDSNCTACCASGRCPVLCWWEQYKNSPDRSEVSVTLLLLMSHLNLFCRLLLCLLWEPPRQSYAWSLIKTEIRGVRGSCRLVHKEDFAKWFVAK